MVVRALEVENYAARKSLRDALNEAHACRENLASCQDRGRELIEEARVARAREQRAREIIETVLESEIARDFAKNAGL